MLPSTHPAIEFFASARGHRYNAAVFDIDAKLLVFHAQGLAHVSDLLGHGWKEFVHQDDVPRIISAMRCLNRDVLNFRVLVHSAWHRVALCKAHIEGLQFCVIEMGQEPTSLPLI